MEENCYGSFCGVTIQNISSGDNVIFNNNIIIKNMTFINPSCIKFLDSGIYVLHFILYLISYGKIAIFINNIQLDHTITFSNNNTNNIIIHEMITIKSNDIVSIKNIDTELSLNISLENNYGYKLNIWKIDDIDEDEDNEIYDHTNFDKSKRYYLYDDTSSDK